MSQFFQTLLLVLTALLITIDSSTAQDGRYQDSEIPTVESAAATRKLSGREAFDLLVSDTREGEIRRSQVVAEKDAKSATQIGWHYFEKSSWGTSEEWFGQALQWSPNSASAAEGVILSRFKSGDEASAYKLSRSYEDVVPKARPLVVGAIESRTWKLINANNLDGAEAELSGLPTDEPKFAAMITEIGERRTRTAAKEEGYAVARETAAAYGADQRIVDETMTSDLIDKALDAQKAGRYEESSSYLDEAEKTGQIGADAQKIRAWNLYHTRNFSDSSSLFEKLYRAKPEKDTAEGLTYSLQQRGQVSDLNQLSNELGAPLSSVAQPVLAAATEKERNRQAQEKAAALAKKKIQPAPIAASSAYGAPVAAASPSQAASSGYGASATTSQAPQPQVAPSRYGAPGGYPSSQQVPITEDQGNSLPIDRPAIARVAKDPDAPESRRIVPATSRTSVGIGFSKQSGDDGLSALRTTELPAAAMTGVFGSNNDQSLTLSVVKKDFDVGTYDGGRAVGSAPVDDDRRVDVATSASTVEPRVAYRNENALGAGPGFTAEVGTTPIGGEVDSSIVGAIGIDQKNETHNWRVGAFSESVQESILSATGLSDPYTGNRWGRVKKTGIGGEGYTSINGGPWGTYGRFELAGLTGENVADNSMLGLTAGISRNIDFPGFEYFSVGPSLNYESYDKNLSHFTYGHGGYFSPESMIQGMIGASFLSETGGSWLSGGYVGLGYQTNDQASAAFLPLSPDGREFDAVSESSVVFTANLQSVWELSSHWHLGASGGYSKTAAYEEYGGALFLRYLWQSQNGLGEADLLKSQ